LEKYHSIRIAEQQWQRDAKGGFHPFFIRDEVPSLQLPAGMQTFDFAIFDLVCIQTHHMINLINSCANAGLINRLGHAHCGFDRFIFFILFVFLFIFFLPVV
jgi:hypothetical protein